jgi:hypothetical protein
MGNHYIRWDIFPDSGAILQNSPLHLAR